MPAISPSVLPVLMLFASNVFMTFAWYGHLKFKETWLPLAILVSWGIAFFEYWLAVPGQSLGQRGVYRGAAQDHAGSDHADRVRRLLGLVSQGAAGLESRAGICVHRARRVFHFSQMVVMAAGAPPDLAIATPRRRDVRWMCAHFEVGRRSTPSARGLLWATRLRHAFPWRSGRRRQQDRHRQRRGDKCDRCLHRHPIATRIVARCRKICE